MHHKLQNLDNMKKFLFILLLLILSETSLNAKQSLSDSLKHSLKDYPMDTNSVKRIILALLYLPYSQPDSALYYADYTLKLSKQLNFNRGIAYSYAIMAEGYIYTGDYSKALFYIYQHLNIFTAMNDVSGINHAYTQLANIYSELGDYKKALEYKLKIRENLLSIGFRETNNWYNPSGEPTIWFHDYNLSLAYLNAEMLDSALKYAESAFRDDSLWPGNPLQMGSIFLLKKDYSTAIRYYNINSPKNYPVDSAKIYIGKATAFKHLHQQDSSLIFALKALDISTRINYAKGILLTSELLSEYYENLDPSKSLNYLKISNSVRDDLFNKSRINQINSIAFNEELRKIDAIAAEKAARNRYNVLSLLGILFTLLITGILLWRNVQHKKKANTLLQQQKEKVENTLAELKSTQAQLIQSEKIATLSQQAEALRLRELDAVKTKLYINITHEFRTPLTVILGVANQVLDNPNEHLKKGLKMIMRNGQNLLTLVNQMLDLSKLESGKLSLQYHHTDVISFLGYIIDGFHSLAENKGIQIHFISVKNQLTMDFDEVRLQQIVTNIISNAVKFTPKGGHVYISTDVKNDSFILKIKDTGIGISEADLPHIFDRFYQADDSHTRNGEGTGIGLALTHELVKLMKGTISVKSKEGQGSEFEVALPLHDISASKEATNQIPFVPSDTKIEYPVFVEDDLHTSLISPNHSEDGSPHVLIADDNEDVLAFIASCLENEFSVEVAKNGLECEELAFNNIPDLIVMDVMMPFKDGFEVCKTLKTDERTSHIPVILLTAKADLESRLLGLEMGADDYLTKPFHQKELLLRIKNLLDLRQQLQQHYLSSLEGRSSINSPENPSNPKFKGVIDLQTGNHHPSIPIASSLENAFVLKVRKTIETHLEEPDFDVEKLCRSLTLSHSQVHRKLSALTGLSATHFIRYVRLIRAKEMILQSRFSIAAIAYDCGFNDPAYFSRIFKQEFGMSPQAWREQNSTV